MESSSVRFDSIHREKQKERRGSLNTCDAKGDNVGAL